MQLLLDDADLADLVRCLDRLRLDEKVKLQWTYPEDRPLARKELVERIPLLRRLGPAALGGLLLSFSAAMALLLPLPPRPGTATSVDVNEPGSRIIN